MNQNVPELVSAAVEGLRVHQVGPLPFELALVVRNPSLHADARGGSWVGILNLGGVRGHNSVVKELPLIVAPGQRLSVCQVLCLLISLQ